MVREIEPIRFTSLPNHDNKVWRRLRAFAFVNEISQVPLSDSEILLTSHHLPIAIDYVDDGLQVVAVTTPRFLRSPLIGPDGQWQRGYMPIALRCLPFRIIPGARRNESLEVAVNLDESDGPTLPIFSTDGSLSPVIEHIAALLRRLEEGKQALQRAAEKLLIADVLTPFQMARLPGTAPLPSRTLTVDRNKLGALSKFRAAHLVSDGFLPIDLAAACIFSQRLMPKLISVATSPIQAEERHKIIPAGVDELMTALKDGQIDDSEMFSFERFEEMSRLHDEKS